MNASQPNATDSSSGEHPEPLFPASEKTAPRNVAGRAFSTPRKPIRILLAEDDGPMRELLAAQLCRCGYQVIECSDGQILVERLASLFLPGVTREDYDLVITDLRMPGFTGLQVLNGLHEYDVPPMILITAFGDEATHAEARRLGAVAVFDKPFRVPDLLAKVREVITLRRRGPTKDARQLQPGRQHIASDPKHEGRIR